MADAFLALTDNKKDWDNRATATRKLFKRVMETRKAKKLWAFYKWNDVRRYFDQADLYMRWKFDSLNEKVRRKETIQKLKYLQLSKQEV